MPAPRQFSAGQSQHVRHLAWLCVCFIWMLIFSGAAPVKAAAGDVDPTFDPGSSGNSFKGTSEIIVQPDGKILVAGLFTVATPSQRREIARLNNDGSLDIDFIKSGSGVDAGGIEAMTLQPDGKILIGGNFIQVNGVPRSRIARLNSDGSLDTTFLASASDFVYAIVLQPDGKILVGGGFQTFNGTRRHGLVRLHSDGTLDTTFQDPLPSGFDSVRAIALQPDGKILVAGGPNGITRLHSDGSIDTTFHAIALGVQVIALQEDGKVLIGGVFTEVNHVPRSKIARLNADGTLDTAFTTSVHNQFFWSVETIVVQPDRKILIAGGLFGGFTTVNGIPRPGLARLKTDGSVDETFLNFTSGPQGAPFSIALEPNGKVLVGGSFEKFNDIPRPGIVRLFGGDSTTNPIDVSRNFVMQHYQDFLNRTPDAGGLAYWTDQIAKCGADQGCLQKRRVAVSDAFFFEQEFQQTGAYVYRLYKVAFGIRPAFTQFMSDRARLVVGEQLDQSKTGLALTFAQSDAFLQKYPSTLTADQFVDALLNTVKQNSGVDLTPQHDTLLSLYDGTDLGRARILRQVAESQAMIDAEYNSSFVLMEYFGYLRRDPDEGGFLFWLEKVNQYPLRDTRIQHAMACAFITSAEYQSRFGSTISHTNRECSQ